MSGIISAARAFGVLRVAWAGLSNACSFLCAPARANVVGQATSRSLLGTVELAVGAGVAKKKGRSIYHGTCVAHFHSSLGVVVVEWPGELWWRGVEVGGGMHRNIAHVLS